MVMKSEEKPKKKKVTRDERNPNPEKIEIFSRVVALGGSQTDAYRTAYPGSKKWKDKSVWSESSEYAKHPSVIRRTKELREEAKKQTAKEFSWEFSDALKAFGRIALKDPKSSQPVKVSALKEMNVMMGYHAATKIDHTSSDSSMSTKPIIDTTKLSRQTMKELLEARDAAKEKEDDDD